MRKSALSPFMSLQIQLDHSSTWPAWPPPNYWSQTPGTPFTTKSAKTQQKAQWCTSYGFSEALIPPELCDSTWKWLSFKEKKKSLVETTNFSNQWHVHMNRTSHQRRWRFRAENSHMNASVVLHAYKHNVKCLHEDFHLQPFEWFKYINNINSNQTFVEIHVPKIDGVRIWNGEEQGERNRRWGGDVRSWRNLHVTFGSSNQDLGSKGDIIRLAS